MVERELMCTFHSPNPYVTGKQANYKSLLLELYEVKGDRTSPSSKFGFKYRYVVQ